MAQQPRWLLCSIMIGEKMGKFYVYDTPEATNEWTQRAKLRISGIKERLDNYVKDKHKDRRHDLLECGACYYFGGRIAGQGFTNYTCQVCEEERTHHNTAVPRICRGCAQKLNICSRCGADIDLKRRRVQKG